MRTLTKAFILLLLALCLAAAAAAEPVETPDFCGALEGSTYENPYMGFGCTLEGWEFQEQDEGNPHPLEKNIMALNMGGIQNVIIRVWNLGSVAVLFQSMGQEALMNAFVEVYGKDRNQDPEIEDVRTEPAITELDGQVFPGMKKEYTDRGIPYYIKQVWIMKDTYVCTITVAAGLVDQTDEILENFYLMK